MYPSNLESMLNQLVKRYRNRAFIHSDPMQFAHACRHQPLQCELTALVSALLSYGRRDLIIKSLSQVLDRANGNLLDYCLTTPEKQMQRDFQSYYYRFNRGEHLVWLFQRLGEIYQEYGSLEALFIQSSNANAAFKERLHHFCDALIANESPRLAKDYGLRYLLPHPKTGGACKRLHLFFRWVVRTDADMEEPVDFGLWTQALSPKDLLIPLDTHVGRLALQWGLSQRKSRDWKAVEDITQSLRQFCPEDPVLYDFALLGYGVETALAKGD